MSNALVRSFSETIGYESGKLMAKHIAEQRKEVKEKFYRIFERQTAATQEKILKELMDIYVDKLSATH